MNLEQWIMIGICLLTWIYGLFNIIRAKKFEEKCAGGSNSPIIILFVGAAISLIFLEASAINITIAIVLLIGGTLCAFIPSGYDKKYIYVRGVKVAFKDIKDMRLVYHDDYAQLQFSKNKKNYRTLSASHENISKLNKCMTNWRRGR